MRFKNTSDHIETYIKAILDQSGIVELQRSQLADTFQVVPSQINYVIKTRFTESRGYLVESKRGGGGYIRIGRIKFSSHHEMLRELLYSIGERVSQEIYEDILQLLVEQELMTKQEMNLLVSVALDRVLGEEAPVVRANMLRQVIQEVDRKGK
ncbi:TPA: CtsR family transcriptional regulator [Streptococcus pneumoniae]